MGKLWKKIGVISFVTIGLLSILNWLGFRYSKMEYIDIPNFSTIEEYQQWAMVYDIEILVEDQSENRLESYPSNYKIINRSNNKLTFNDKGILMHKDQWLLLTIDVG